MALIEKGKNVAIASTFTPFYSYQQLRWLLPAGTFCLTSLPVPGPQFCQEILVALLDFTQLKMSLQPENQQFCHSDQKRKDGELCS